MNSLQIEIIYDPSCPWCYIGKRQLHKAIATRPQYQVQLRWWPFLLNPDMPPEGADRTSFLIRKYGSEARVGRILSAIAHVGHSVEIQFAFDRIGRAPNTVNAHRLVRFAEKFDRAEMAVEALFHSHFVRGFDIGDLFVLRNIGKMLALDTEAVTRHLMGDEDVQLIYEANERAHRLGINGVPAFVFAGSFVICGAQDPKVLSRMLDVAHKASDQELPHTFEHLTRNYHS